MALSQVPPDTASLVVEAATKSFGKNKALTNVSLRAGPGVTAVLGQNGAGKTTLIRSALGLLSLDSGSVSLFGQAASRREGRERVGVMLQDSDLPDLLSARELLELFASYYPAPLSVGRVLELADIGAFCDQRYKKLSGGQKRRVQFALAIVGNPDLVFLDEPTTGLDPEARKALWSVVRAFVSQGKAIVLTTHYLEEADTLADRVVVMRGGTVIADSTAAEVRSALGGSVIRCSTSMTDEALRQIDGVTQITRSGKISEIYSGRVEHTLREMLAQDEQLSDLSVSRPNLEDIFSGDYA